MNGENNERSSLKVFSSHLWTSIGKFSKFIGHAALIVNLQQCTPIVSEKFRQTREQEETMVTQSKID
jgi:hypothetical protein